jgi:RHS repeat-associated protein
VDELSGVILFPGQYQQASPAGYENLVAQVNGSTGPYTYSWNTSGLSDTFSVSGASTANLQIQWGSLVSQPITEPVTLTVTDANSHQESVSLDFLLPTTAVVTMPTSASWPTSLAPDQVAPGAPAIPGQNVSVDANSGALDSTINLPSYNPTVPAIALTYNSLTANPLPMILVHHTIPSGSSAPATVNATLTFNSTVGTTWYYNTSGFIPGDIQQIALQANATSLSTGRYSYSAQVVDGYSTPTTTTYSGSATVLNQSTSAFGDGWTLQGLEQITSATGGVILSLGDNGESLWFSGSPGVGQNYTSPAGDFSTLTKTSTGYTRTLADGTQITFDSNGNQTASIDLNGLHTTYTYSSGLLSTITDPFGAVTTFSYVSNKLSSIQDPSGRHATFTFSGNNLSAVQQADGSRVTYTYDSSGRMTSDEDQRTNVTTVVFDSAERVGTITRPDSTTQEFSAYQEAGWTNSGTSGSPAAATLLAAAATDYTDPKGNLDKMRPDWYGLGQLGQATDANGDVASNDINSSGEPFVSVDTLNRITQVNYNSSGMPTKITYPDLTNDQFTYNSDNEPLTHTDEVGNITTYTYDSNGNNTVTEDALSKLTTMTYTSLGEVQSSTDPNNRTTTYQYDSQGRLTTITYSDSTTNLASYDSQGDVTQSTDALGHATTYSYDALNRETGTTDALGNITTYVYDAAGNKTQEQDPTPSGQSARTTTYAYDSMDRLTTMTDPLGHTTVYSYDADGNPITVTDPLGTTTTTYDSLNDPTAVSNPVGTTTATYDAARQKLTAVDSQGTTTYTYSIRGWNATTTDPQSHVSTYTYSAAGQVTGYSSPGPGGGTPATSNYTYDGDHHQLTSEDGLGNITTSTYDSAGNLVSVKDPNGNVTSYAYDSHNRLTTITDALGDTTVYGYDAAGNRTTVTDGLGHTTTTLYDAANRATTIITPTGTTTITYDSAGRETSLTDPVGNTTSWTYNANDQVTQETEPNGHTVTYLYDAHGEVTDTTDADGRRTTFSYDDNGNMTGETWLNGSGSAIYRATYTYNAENQMTGATDSFATLTMVYDSDGHLGTLVTSGPGTGQTTVTLTYSYNQAGLASSVTDSLSNQGVTSTSYDSDNRVTSITQSFGGTVGPNLAFSYDNGSRLTTITRQSGTGSTATIVYSAVSYDAANRVTTMTDSVSVWQGFGWNTTPLATQVYSYDNANRVTSEKDAEGTASFTYDNSNELTGVTGSRNESYSYDSNGNRNSTGYSTGTGNELTASPGYTYTYDNAGNMISSTNTSTHVTTTYTYDYENRLTQVTSGGSVVATYTYNALNQRIGVDDGGTQTWTVYNGTSADANPYADFNGSGGSTVRYLFGPTVVNGAVTTGILARTSSGGTTAWYLTDKLGSVRDVVDTSGNELDHIVYDSFGNVLSQSNSANGDRFLFAGMQFDTTMGQYYDHARDYSEAVGRFTGQDSYGFAAHDTNLYRYTYNNSTNNVDPSGHILPILAGAGLGALGGATVYLTQCALTGTPVTTKGLVYYTLAFAAAGAFGGTTSMVFSALRWAKVGISGSNTLYAGLEYMGLASIRTSATLETASIVITFVPDKLSIAYVILTDVLAGGTLGGVISLLSPKELLTPPSPTPTPVKTGKTLYEPASVATGANVVSPVCKIVDHGCYTDVDFGGNDNGTITYNNFCTMWTYYAFPDRMPLP